jgi:hypothetical protein
MVGAFLAAAPYTLLDLPNFLNEFARLSSEYRRPPAVPEPLWIVYLKYLRIALGWPGSLLVISGLSLGAWRVAAGPHRARWFLAVLFPIVYFRFISQQTIVFARYLLPIVPFLSILAAAAVVAVVGWMRRTGLPAQVRHALTIALTLVAVGPPAYTAINYDADAAKTWTQELAYNWIRQNLPAGASIRLEGSVAVKLPAIYKVSYAKALRLDPPDFAASGIQYLVASSQSYGSFFQDPASFPAEYADYQRIFAATDEVARFTPTADHPGPELRILKVRQP